MTDWIMGAIGAIFTGITITFRWIFNRQIRRIDRNAEDIENMKLAIENKVGYDHLDQRFREMNETIKEGFRMIVKDSEKSCGQIKEAVHEVKGDVVSLRDRVDKIADGRDK